jgi:hypothetical protein
MSRVRHLNCDRARNPGGPEFEPNPIICWKNQHDWFEKRITALPQPPAQ